MTKEELLKPRYKCIADYPESPFGINEILDLHKWNSELLEFKYFDSNEDPNYLSNVELDKCSANFKKLAWYEERKVEDMPEYLKEQINEEDYFYLKGTYKMINDILHIMNVQINIFYPISTYPNLEPSTQSEYEQQTKTI